MPSRTYPPLSQVLATQLEAVRMQLEFDPSYLVADECPYGEDLKKFLKEMVKPARLGREDSTVAVFTPDQDDDQQADSLIAEVKSVINSMKRLQEDMDRDNVDVGDRMTFFKNYGSMMERFLGLQEKAHGIKQMYEFQRIVIQTLEQVLNKDQVQTFKDQLKSIHISLPAS